MQLRLGTCFSFFGDVGALPRMLHWVSCLAKPINIALCRKVADSNFHNLVILGKEVATTNRQ